MNSLKIALILILLGSGLFPVKAFGQEPVDPVQEMLKILLKGRTRIPSKQRLYDTVLEDARSHKEIRDALVKILKERLEASFESRFGSTGLNELEVLRKLDGKEALPLVKAWWDRPFRISVHRMSEGLHLSMLNAISEWLPPEERFPFLKEVHNDLLEKPRLHMEAILLLCRIGSEEAVNHLMEDFLYDHRHHCWSSDNEDGTPVYPKESWDRDGDQMHDFLEKGLLLDPTNPDTDGDSILDGRDHNPLLHSEGILNPEQIMARYLVYLHATFNVECTPPFPDKTFILPETVLHKGKKIPNLFGKIEFIGVPGVFLHYTEEQLAIHWSRVGYGAHVLRLHFVKDLGPDRKEYSLEEFVANLGGARIRIVVKRCGEFWLPVEWEVVEWI